MVKTFIVDGMGCMHCVNTIESAFGAMDSVEEVKVMLDDASMTLTYDETKLNDEAVCNKIAELGYKCRI
jgi:copper chaperone